MEENYQMNANVGDIVLMPNGTVGIVTSWDILCGGICKEVKVHPFTNWLYRFYLSFLGKNCFYDKDINRLKLLHKAKEVR